MKFIYGGKKVLIMGGSCSLAITLSKFLIEEGLLPILSYRSEKGANKIKNGLSKYSEKYETIRLDLKDRSSLQNFKNQADNDIDYLVDFIQGDFESLIAAADNDDTNRYFIENISRRAEILKTVIRHMVKKKKRKADIYIIHSSSNAKPGTGFLRCGKTCSRSAVQEHWN